ncbi:hypothetical protein E2562_000225, partial [Oryza meyeriana var. granulata]
MRVPSVTCVRRAVRGLVPGRHGLGRRQAGRHEERRNRWLEARSRGRREGQTGGWWPGARGQADGTTRRRAMMARQGVREELRRGVELLARSARSGVGSGLAGAHDYLSGEGENLN